jgi:hypothetical protein
MPSEADRNAGAAISRMPKAVREAVSAALLDGADWRAVRKICAEAGHPGVRAQNVTNYRKGAHKDWLAREERVEALRRDSEATAAVMAHYVQHGGSPAEAGLLTAAEMMNQALVNMGPETLCQLIADEPKAIFGMVRELSRVADLLSRKTHEARTRPADEEKATLTPEERTAALKDIFGLPS